MELQNESAGLEMDRKRKATGHDKMRRRQESAEAELYDQNRQNASLRTLLKQQKRKLSGEELTHQLRETKVLLEEQKSNVQELTHELSNRNSRVMQLEADKFFMAGDLQEKCIVEENLR
jgi:hypothetical protein